LLSLRGRILRLRCNILAKERRFYR